MKFYKLCYDHQHASNFINCTLEKSGRIDCTYLSTGEKEENWKNVLYEFNSVDENEMTDYIWNCDGYLMVSEKVLKLFEKCLDSANYQALPATIVDKAEKLAPMMCYVINVLDIVDDAVDLEHSVYSYFEIPEDNIKMLNMLKPCLKREKLLNHDLFRTREDIMPIYVSENVKAILEQNKLKGFAFREVKTIE